MNKPPELDKEVLPAEWANLPVLSASQLRISPPRTPDDIRRDVKDGRVSEMTPNQAGY